jgi:hypothetical protein
VARSKPVDLLDGMLRLLADGRPRSSQEVLSEGIARGLLPRDLKLDRVDHALHTYVQREATRGPHAHVVRDADRRYRLNHPRDTWPEPRSPLRDPDPSPAALAALDVVRKTSQRSDPLAFEHAVCTLFGTLGFATTHVGGYAAPDGYMDAPLGVLGYRVILECKTATRRAGVYQPNVAEPARYRAAYAADASAIIGPAYASADALLSELRIHDVSAWTVDDLAAVVHAGLNPHEMRPLFAAGFAEDAIDELLWNRAHGIRKRIAVIAETLQRVGAREQQLALAAKPADAARLTVDAAMLCVDEALAAGGSDARCERTDVEAAFAWMTHPLVGSAVWADASRDAIVVIALPQIAPAFESPTVGAEKPHDAAR